MDSSKLSLQLEYGMPDQTSLWSEKTGNKLATYQMKVFRPCQPKPLTVFPRTDKFTYTDFELCEGD